MSVQRAVWLWCDVGDDDCPGSDDATVGAGADTVAEARRHAQRDGWHRTRDGRDICPDCWEAGER